MLANLIYTSTHHSKSNGTTRRTIIFGTGSLIIKMFHPEKLWNLKSQFHKVKFPNCKSPLKSSDFLPKQWLQPPEQKSKIIQAWALTVG